MSFAASALAKPLRIRDAAVVEGVFVERASSHLIVHGILRDSQGVPLVGHRVTTQDVPSTSCAEGEVANTAQDGTFCLRVHTQLGSTVTVVSEDHAYYDAASRLVVLEPRSFPLSLRLEVENEPLDLDQPEQRVAVVVSSAPRRQEHHGVTLTAFGPSDRPLWTGDGEVSGRAPAVFRIPSRQLEPGTLRFSMKTQQGGAPSTTERAILARATVRLALLSGPSAEPSGVSTTLVELSATANGGPVDSGRVIAREGSTEVASSGVRASRARLEFRQSGHRGPRDLVLEYVASEPSLRAGEPLLITWDSGPQSIWRWAPLVVLALIASWWLMSGWRRPSRKQGSEAPVDATAVTGHMSFQPEPAATGWRGLVVDTHTSEPLAGAEVFIEMPSVQATRRVQTTTDSEGRFALDLDGPASSGARLRVQAPFHADLLAALPPKGRLTLHLPTRRRALLARLETRARAAGKPWFVPPRSPTPREVSSTAANLGNSTVHRWASRVEALAYGPQPVDEPLESSLGVPPPLDQSNPDKR